ncbi:MAG: deoxyribonuclease IV [Actinomycetota bacterium]
MQPVGAHVAPDMPLKAAEGIGADLVQIFLSDPQSFKKPPPRRDAEELKASPIDIVVHAPYLINVCSPKSNVRYGSRNVLKQTCAAAELLDVKAVVVHGGHAEDDIKEGFGRWVRTLEQLETSIHLLIENTPGGANAVAKRFDDLARLWDAIGKANTSVKVGTCFDTCHAHAAGEDLSTAVERVLAITGKIDLMHCNDAKDGAGTGRDRHTNLGKGQVGEDNLRHMIAAAKAPVICETPGGAEELIADLAFVRSAIRS